jgi:hypothetical protein
VAPATRSCAACSRPIATGSTPTATSCRTAT